MRFLRAAFRDLAMFGMDKEQYKAFIKLKIKNKAFSEY